MSVNISVSPSSSPSGEEHPRMTVRQVPFLFAAKSRSVGRRKTWHESKPEFAHIVNAASIAMPYLEPYLIRTMRVARPMLKDALLEQELDFYIRQEATHYKQHKKFNTTLIDTGYQSVGELEEQLSQDYENLEAGRSLRFNLAYAEGFESMALALGEMLIEDREYLFGGSDSSVASLVLWHFVEEIEHKNVAFDVFDHLYGSYLWRMVGLFYATGHIFWRTGQGYRALLKEDDRWSSMSSRWKLAKLLVRILRNIAPKWLRILRPGYHPSQVSDPTWGLAWSDLFSTREEGAAQLDTSRLDADLPVAVPEALNHE
ncbi:MAG: putative metal-dependent hydrolase [Candidatus Azotimanducaceae bacterium]|jgi:predicted metal-dependent hydrolase